MTALPARVQRITLAHKYMLNESDLWLTGTQSIVRMILEQRQLDRAANRDTAGFVSGYRGSPLAGVDLELARASDHLQDANIVFQPGINEDLAATAVWGTQQVGLFQGRRYEGVFGLWYGKSPGLDRSTDAIRHANMAGTSPLGGVLAIIGDDPDCKSSTLPSDSAGILRDLQIPILDPTDVGELIEFGLYGWALSRYCGCWTSMLAQTSVMDSSATIKLTERSPFVFPPLAFDPHIRLVDTPHEQERRMAQKLSLVREFTGANPINRTIGSGSRPKLAIVTTGKSYTNVRQALNLLGLSSNEDIGRAGIRLIKLGLLWPTDRLWLRDQVIDAQVVFVVESKHAFLETELKAALYGVGRASILGKEDIDGSELLSSFGELQIDAIIDALLHIAIRLEVRLPSADMYLKRRTAQRSGEQPRSMNTQRKPLFCPGCPHSGSTKVPEGSRAFAGIGCHYMAQWMHRETYLFTHMGGEGANWIGQAPFTDTDHVFVNLGDGTYSHSGLMAIRAAVAAKVNVTYKILFNDAVAMTGGQAVEGDLTVSDVVAQVKAEGVKTVRVVAEDVAVHKGASYKVYDRKHLHAVQRELRSIEGCTVLIVDHACANEKRRKRKRGLMPLSSRYVMINEDICEHCGDCVVQSGCSAVKTVQTKFGEKRQIDQAHCIQDLACVEGYCPALVEIKGRLRQHEKLQSESLELPAADVPASAGILIAGVGGTGVITLSQILAMAAHLDGKQASSLEMTGLAQKGGAVVSHVRIGPEHIWRTRLAESETDVLIAADPVTACSAEVAKLLDEHCTRAIVNNQLSPSHLAVVDHGQDYSITDTIDVLADYVLHLQSIDAMQLADESAGSSAHANMALLGFAYQQGWIPVSLSSLRRAIELNGVAIKANLTAFEAGRRSGSRTELETLAKKEEPHAAMTLLDQFIELRFKRLCEYQSARYADLYLNTIKRIRQRDTHTTDGDPALTRIVADALFHFMAIKDEYEVARLLTHDEFTRSIAQQFEADSVAYAFAPTWLRKDPTRGKVRIGPWIKPLLHLLVAMRTWRGTRLDPFRFSAERQFERQLLAQLTTDIELAVERVNERNYDAAVDLFTCYREVKGFGYVRETNWRRCEERIIALRQELAPRVLHATLTSDGGLQHSSLST